MRKTTLPAFGGPRRRSAQLAAEDMSFANISAALQVALGDDPDGDGDTDWPWIVDIFPAKSTFVYCFDGECYEQTYILADEGTATLTGTPQRVQSVTTYQPVDIAKMSSRVEGYDIIYEGEIFRAGEYPDKGCVAAPARLAAIASRITQARPVNDQHGDRSPFYKSLHEKDDEGRLKYGLIKARAMEAGKWLWGRVRLPKWVADALGDELPVSVGMWLDGSGQPTDIHELSLVDEGRVPTAVISRKLAAAFCAMAGARHSAADMDHVQSIHDHAASLGAVCMEDDSAEMAGARHSGADLASFQSIHDFAVEQGAACPSGAEMRAIRRPNDPGRATTRTKEQQRMSWIDKARAFFGGNAEARQQAGLTEADLATDPAAPTRTTVVDPTVEARMTEFDRQTATINARFDAQNTVILKLKAAEFARQAIEVSRRALPSEREDLEANYILCANADGAGGRATFSAEGTITEGANVERLKKSIDKRRQLSVYEQKIPDATVTDDTGKEGTLAAWASARLAQSVGDYNTQGRK